MTSDTSYLHGERSLMSGDTTGRTSKDRPRTDWRRLRGMTDEQVHAAVVADPEIRQTDEAFWKEARVVMPQPQMPLAEQRVVLILDIWRLRCNRATKGHYFATSYFRIWDAFLTFINVASSIAVLALSSAYWIIEANNRRLNIALGCVGIAVVIS